MYTYQLHKKMLCKKLKLIEKKHVMAKETNIFIKIKCILNDILTILKCRYSVKGSMFMSEKAVDIFTSTNPLLELAEGSQSPGNVDQ